MEDFSFFKDQFIEAAKGNRVPRSDQADKLRERLTGRALQHMPKACKDIKEAWTALDAAFGNPRTLLNYRLKKVRSMPGLTDTLLQSDPGLTATWYLDFRAAVEDIYDLGTKRASLEHACFNPETITIITDKLPFSDSYLLHDNNLEGKAHLKEIMNMIKKRKANAQKRANNKYKSDIKSSTLNALHTHVALAKPSLPDTPNHSQI